MSEFFAIIVFTGAIGSILSWMSFWTSSECINHSEFIDDCENCIKIRIKKFRFACYSTLFFFVWPIALSVFLIKSLSEISKEKKKKELQQCICPECERKFLQE